MPDDLSLSSIDMKRLLALIAASLVLVGCGGGDSDVVEQDSSENSKSDSKDKQPADEQGALIDSGFGQRDEYVGLAAVVKNKSDHAGQTVTVSFNIMDKSGELLKTESQVDSFAWPGQELAVVTQADLQPGQKAAEVKATLLVEDEGTFADSMSDDLGSDEAKVAKDEYGGLVARVELTNPTNDVLKNPKVAAVCKNGAGKIAGSGFTFPDLIAANGKYADDIDVVGSDSLKTCTVYLSPGLL